MNAPTENLAVMMATARSRREMIQTLGATMIAGVLGSRAAAQTSGPSSSPVSVPSGKWRTVEMRLYTEKSPGYTTLKMPERGIARVTMTGKPTAALVSQVIDGDRVELSIYEHATMKLTRRVILGRDETPVDLSVASLSGLMAVATGSVAISDRPVDFHEETDCCVNCTFGQVCACAVLCDSCNPGGGHCCDPGCC